MELRVECNYCKRTETLIKIGRGDTCRGNLFECKTCGTIQEVDTHQEEIT
jgi:uncharacterized Zn finger protein